MKNIHRIRTKSFTTKYSRLLVITWAFVERTFVVFASTVCIVHLAWLSWKTEFVLVLEILLSLFVGLPFVVATDDDKVDGLCCDDDIVVVVVVDVVIVYYYGHHILLCLPVARNIGGSIKIVADLFVSFFITIRTSQV